MIFDALSLSIYRAHKCWAGILGWNCRFQCRPNWFLCHDKVDLCRNIATYFSVVRLCCEIVATFLAFFSLLPMGCLRDKVLKCRDIFATSMS